MANILDFNNSTPEIGQFTSPYQNRCEFNLPRLSVEKFNSFALDNSQAVFVHFQGINLSMLQPSKEPEILDPLNLVWVENITAPFLSLNLGFNVYSFTTLWRKVLNMSVMVGFESSKCLLNMSYSCITSSLATAFLTNVSQQRGALCYVLNKTKNNDEMQYMCCKGNSDKQQIECNIPASISPQMSGIFFTIVIVATISFFCFPATLVSFPDKDDCSETISGNVQVRNPFYRIANCAVQTLRRYSCKYYLVNVIRKLLIGFSLPFLFYIYWGVTAYTAKYDIPKMFNDAVRMRWQEENLGNAVLFIKVYSIVAVIISLLPRDKTAAFYITTDKVHEYSSIHQNKKLDWMKPYSISGNVFEKFCFGFKGLTEGSRSSPSKRIINFILSCFLILIIFPVTAILIFIGYSCYASPLSQEFSRILSHVFISAAWLDWYLLKVKWFEKLKSNAALFQAVSGVVFLPLGILITYNIVALGFMISSSLMLISRMITYLCMGIVASKDDLLPPIVLFSLFGFYIWNCFSDVESKYKHLLDETFEKCKDYQKEEEKQVILIDNKGVPRICRLSGLFQKVVDEIQPFSKVYTVMFIRIIMIGSFLSITYWSILVYGETSLNDFTKTLAIALGGLIPKFIEIFGGGNSKNLLDKENGYRVKKIVRDFFVSENAVKEAATQTDAVKEADTQTDAVKEADTQTDAVKGAATQTDAVKEAATQTYAVKEAATQTDAVKEAATQTDAVKEDATQTDAVKEAATQTDAVKKDATQTDAVKKDATQTDAVKEAATQTDAVKEDANQTEVNLSDDHEQEGSPGEGAEGLTFQVSQGDHQCTNVSPRLTSINFDESTETTPLLGSGLQQNV
ncbi:uncharacterized protein LOC114576556 [Exaiptasia diaphana]|uniref:Uncharacterized protein n=1 Tax=Exaiptasia diaphana TaxID=2652724 RepID=A0A913YVV8_EXADI|nr:uncharacterized protein LOC114576556 [Exaiptasia diaphana]